MYTNRNWPEVEQMMAAHETDDRLRHERKVLHRAARAAQLGACKCCGTMPKDQDLFLLERSNRVWCVDCLMAGETAITWEGDELPVETPMVSGLQVSFMRAQAPRPGERKIRAEDAHWGRGVDVTDQLPEVWRSMGPWVLEDAEHGGAPMYSYELNTQYKLTHVPSGRLAGQGSWMGILARLTAWARSPKHVHDIRKHPRIESMMYKKSPKTAAQKEG